VSGQIKSITDFGVFIGLAGNIDGLIHLSDLSWTQTGEEAIRNFKKGDEVTAVVLSIDTDKERISLGVKQLEADPSGATEKVASEKPAAKKKAKAEDTQAKAVDDAASAGTTNLGALLKAKMDSKNN
jgi:small subunit ribosomal protein S1